MLHACASSLVTGFYLNTIFDIFILSLPQENGWLDDSNIFFFFFFFFFFFLAKNHSCKDMSTFKRGFT